MTGSVHPGLHLLKLRFKCFPFLHFTETSGVRKICCKGESKVRLYRNCSSQQAANAVLEITETSCTIEMTFFQVTCTYSMCTEIKSQIILSVLRTSAWVEKFIFCFISDIYWNVMFASLTAFIGKSGPLKSSSRLFEFHECQIKGCLATNGFLVWILLIGPICHFHVITVLTQPS